ncbi:MAG: ankyrin repeat domain-containing protein, partial [Nitrosopumilus sp.]
SNYLLARSAEHKFLYGVKKAIETGADIHYNKNIALRWASLNGNYDIVKVLLKNGADAKDIVALRYASQFGHDDVVELLKKWS